MNKDYVRDLDLNLLRAFAVVAEEGSITRAASRLHLTQPAISAAMRRLTAFVGAALITRQARGVALTSRGTELLVATQAHLQPLLAATMTVPAFDPMTSLATVNIGLMDGAEGVVLPPLLKMLRDEAPKMRLVIVPAQFRSVEELLLSKKVDLALCVAEALPRSIRRRALGFGRFVCVFDPRFRKLSRSPSKREYFASEHVAVTYASDSRGIVEDAFGKARNVRVSVPSFSYVADVVDGSPLVGTVPMMLAESVVKARPHLRIAPLPVAHPQGRLDLLWSRVTDDDRPASFLRGLVERLARPRTRP